MRNYCEFCGSGPSCAICGRGLTWRGGWRRQVLSFAVEAAAFLGLAAVAYYVASAARGTP